VSSYNTVKLHRHRVWCVVVLGGGREQDGGGSSANTANRCRDSPWGPTYCHLAKPIRSPTGEGPRATQLGIRDPALLGRGVRKTQKARRSSAGTLLIIYITPPPGTVNSTAFPRSILEHAITHIATPHLRPTLTKATHTLVHSQTLQPSSPPGPVVQSPPPRH
jgi:hypothetical protein